MTNQADRFGSMLAAGYDPRKTYGSMPLCYCGKKPEYIVRANGSQVEHVCVEHFAAWKRAR